MKNKINPASLAVPTSLIRRRLGGSDLEITPIGFGAWAAGGGDWQYSWGHQEDSESIAAIERAVDLGVNWIDTAAIYGLGHSEEVVGRALKNISKSHSHAPYVFTKCGLRWGSGKTIYRSLKKESIREELESSLRRLQLDAMDLYQIHWPDPEAEIEEGWTELALLKEEGKVRWIGVSNFNVEQMKRAQRIAPITSLQPPFSILRPAVAGEILPFCSENNIGVIVYSPMTSGLLTGKMSAERVKAMPQDDWRRKSPEFNPPRLTRNMAIAEFLREIGKQHGVEPGVVAIAWTLHNPAVTGAIVGGRRPAQVEGTFPAAAFRLTDEEFTSIEEFRKSQLELN